MHSQSSQPLQSLKSLKSAQLQDETNLISSASSSFKVSSKSQAAKLELEQQLSKWPSLFTTIKKIADTEIEPTLVLFDFDGTVINSIPLIIACFEHSFSSIGMQSPGTEKIQATIGMPLKQAASLFVAEAQIADFLAAYEQFQRQNIRQWVAIYQEAYYCLVALKYLHFCFAEKGQFLETGLFSSRRKWSLEIIFDTFALANLFDVIKAGDEVPGHKPNAEPLLFTIGEHEQHWQEFCKKQQLKAIKPIAKERIYYVGDANFDIGSANAANVQAVLVDWSINSPASFANLKIDYHLSKTESFLTKIFRK